MMKLIGHILVCFTVITECTSLSFFYNKVPACDGKKGMEHIWSILEDVSKIRCVLMCDSEVMCVLLSYNADTRVCYLHTHTLFDLLPTMVPDSSYTCLLPSDYLESWVASIIKSSTQLEGYTPNFIKGEANRWVWIPLPGTKPYIELTIDIEMYLERIYIYEVLGSVAFSDISVQNPAGDWVAVWTGSQVAGTPGDRVFSPDLMIPNFKVSAVRLDIYMFGSVGKLDAVKVVGKENQRLEGYTPNFIKGEANRWVWIPLPGTKPYIELTIDIEMYLERIYIYEVLGSVAFSDISVQNPAGDWVAVWTGSQVAGTPGDRVFSPDLMIPNFKVSAVRLDIYMFGSVGKLDAVKVVGKENQRLRN